MGSNFWKHQLAHATCTMNISLRGDTYSMTNQEANVIRIPGRLYSIQTKRQKLKNRTL